MSKKAEESLDQQTQEVREAFRQVYPAGSGLVSSNDMWVVEVYADRVIIEVSGAYYQSPYSSVDDEIVFAPREQWTEVERSVDWTQKAVQQTVEYAKRNPLKSIAKTDDWLTVGNYIILFGDEDHRDLEGEYFTKNTQIDSSYTDINMVIEDFEHGWANAVDGMGPTAHDILGRVDMATKRVDDYGVWVNRLLNRRSEYVRHLEPLIEAGMVGTSSEADPDGAEITEKGEIVKWPLVRDTLTFSPAEPRMMSNNALSAAIKHLGITFVKDAKPEAGRSPAADVEANVSKKPSIKAQEKIKMKKEQLAALKSYAELNGLEVDELTEEQQAAALKLAATQEPVDVQAVVEEATKSAVKAALEAAPALNEDKAKAVSVTLDEADRPFKSMAEQLFAVKAEKIEGAYAAEKKYPRLKFFKATGASEGVPSDGGLLLEPTFTSEILKPMHETGQLSSLARKLPVSSNSNSGWINGVDEVSRVDGSRWGGIRGYRLAEGATKTASKPTFRRINWELKKYAAVVVATDELLQDAAMFNEIVRVGVGEELSFMLNADMFNGLGLAGALGFMQSGSLITVTRDSGSKILGADISAMWNRMDLRGRANAVWLIGNDSQPQLDNLFAVGSTAVLYPYAGINNGIQSLYGRPVVTTEYNASLNTTGDIALVDMSQYLLWEKGGVQSDVSIHVYFLSDETAFRFVMRADGKPAVDVPLTPYIGSTTTSPFVVLGSAT